MCGDVVDTMTPIDSHEMGWALPAIGTAEARDWKSDAGQAGKLVDQGALDVAGKCCGANLACRMGQPIDMPMANAALQKMASTAGADTT